MRLQILIAHNFPGRGGCVAYTAFIPTGRRIPAEARDALSQLGGNITIEPKGEEEIITIEWREEPRSADHATKKCRELRTSVHITLCRCRNPR
jgi:hypothetical protein